LKIVRNRFGYASVLNIIIESFNENMAIFEFDVYAFAGVHRIAAARYYFCNLISSLWVQKKKVLIISDWRNNEIISKFFF